MTDLVFFRLFFIVPLNDLLFEVMFINLENQLNYFKDK